MPLDGLTLGFVARELSEKLTGGRIDRVQQPEADEIHLLIRSQGANHRLLLCASAHHARLHLTSHSKTNPQEPPMFCMLLRKHLQGGRVTSVRTLLGDRIVEMDVEAVDDFGDMTLRTLVLEVMGRHSNLILRDQGGRIIDAVHHVTHAQSRKRQVLPGLAYEPAPAQDKKDPLAATEQELRDLLSQPGLLFSRVLQDGLYGLSPQTAQELALRISGDPQTVLAEESAAWSAALHTLFAQLPHWTPPVLLLGGEEEPIDVYPFMQRRFDASQQRPVPEGISAALDQFYTVRDHRERLGQKATALSRTLRQHMERNEKKLGMQQQALESEEETERLRIFGELLTANLYRVEKGLPFVSLENFYDPEESKVDIPLDIRLTPAQNAQRYFKQYQKACARKRLAADQIEKIQEEMAFLEMQMDDLRKCTTEPEIDEIRSLLVDRGLLRANHNRRKAGKSIPSVPFRYFSSDGQEILVGKNGQQNERMTQSASPDATWLHAKDMPGSHVLITDHEVTEQTLLQAAMLAAYYSKGSTSSRVPVDYTLRRYVKKPGGSAPGFVIYTHQHTLYITPNEEEVRKMRQKT